MSIRILRQGLPVIGFAKLGEPGEKAPVKFDHIELTTAERDEEDCLVTDVEVLRRVINAGAQTCGGCQRSKDLAKRYGVPEFERGLPIEMGILLPYDSLESNFPHKLAYHKGRTEFCRGDGETAERRKVIGKETIENKQVDKLGDFEAWGPCGNTCPDFIARRCKPKARLRFVLGVQQNVGGCYEFRTTSWNSIANLQESLEMIAGFTSGTLSWIPLHFEVHPQTVQPKGGGRAQRAYIARITFRGSPMSLLETVKGNLQLRAPLMNEIRQLEARLDRKWESTPEEIADFREEFDPDNLAAENGAPPPDPQPAPPRTSAALPAPADRALGGPPAQQSAQSDPPENGFADAPIAREEKKQIWEACKQRAQELAMEANTLLRMALRAHGYEKSDEILMSELEGFMETVRTYPQNAKPQTETAQAAQP